MVRAYGATSLIWLSFSLAIPSVAGAVEVTAQGEALLRDDPQEAYELALGRAQVAAIEKVVGITIESEFNQRAREWVRDDRSRFRAELDDRLNKRSSGFIARYEVLGRERAELMGQEVLRVTIRAEVFESKIRAEIERLAELLEATDNPRVMVVVQEVVRELDGTERINKTGRLGGYLEEAFQREGFQIQGATKAKVLAAASVNEFEAFHNNVAGALQIARAEGADFLVAGRIVLADRGMLGDSAPYPSLANRVQVEVDAHVRVLMTATGEVLSPAPVQHKELGSDFSRAIHRIYRGSRGRGFNVVEKMTGRFLPDVKARLERIANEGRVWMVELDGVENFRRQGRPFLRLLERLPGVISAKQRAFAAGKLEVEVECRCTAAELQSRLFRSVESEAAFRTLDLAESGAGRLAFRL